MIRLTERDTVTIFTMQHSPANALDLEFSQKLVETLKEAESSSSRAFVLTGTGNIFSAGVHLPRMVEGGAEYLKDFLPALRSCLEAIVMFPRPLVAAINGHAIAGGCLLAAACDQRIMSTADGRIGVPELRVGVPFPVVALELVRWAVPSAYLQEVVYGEQAYSPSDARTRGLVDELAPTADLMSRACDAAESLGRIHPPTFAMSKRQLRQPLLDRIAADRPRFSEELAGIWSDPETLKAVAAYVAKTMGK